MTNKEDLEEDNAMLGILISLLISFPIWCILAYFLTMVFNER